MLSSASNTSLQATFSRVWKQAWLGYAHNAVRPKTLSHLVARLGTVKRNAMSCQGFSTSPHASARERLFSCAHVIAQTCKLSTNKQKLCNPHLAFGASSHKLVSVERAAKSLKVVYNERKRIN